MDRPTYAAQRRRRMAQKLMDTAPIADPLPPSTLSPSPPATPQPSPSPSLVRNPRKAPSSRPTPIGGDFELEFVCRNWSCLPDHAKETLLELVELYADRGGI